MSNACGISLSKDEIELFKREKGERADSYKLLLHYARPDGINIRHQYIYENSDGELRNFVFITNKDNIVIQYKNYLYEILTSKDSPVSTSMEPIGAEIKFGLSYLNS